MWAVLSSYRIMKLCIIFCLASIRLVDESGNTRAVFKGEIEEATRGRVELQINGEWHTICSQGFGLKEANVICNQLGLNGTRRVRTGYYGEGSGGIVTLRNNGCDGGETDIRNCGLLPVSTNNTNCSHDQDVGVECLGNLNVIYMHCSLLSTSFDYYDICI